MFLTHSVIVNSSSQTLYTITKLMRGSTETFFATTSRSPFKSLNKSSKSLFHELIKASSARRATPKICNCVKNYHSPPSLAAKSFSTQFEFGKTSPRVYGAETGRTGSDRGQLRLSTTDPSNSLPSFRPCTIASDICRAESPFCANNGTDIPRLRLSL